MKSKEIKRHVSSLLTFATAMLIALPAQAQQISGTPGSPDATVTIDGKQLPPPPLPFGGVIKESALDSKSYWPPRVVPPKGAPNILLIMTDDQGYGVSSTFGGVIPTPALDRVAKAGLRYTQFHSTALCSPTRAALITGRNHHSAGFGVIARVVDGFPGLRFRHRAWRTPRSARSSRRTVIATSWFGKNHNTPAFQLSVSGPYDQWPSGMGFRIFLRLHGRRDRPVDTVPVPRSHPDFPVDWQEGLQPHHRPGGRGHQIHARPERGRTRQAVLRLLRARRHPLAAPAEAGMDREVQRQVRHGL